MNIPIINKIIKYSRKKLSQSIYLKTLYRKVTNHPEYRPQHYFKDIKTAFHLFYHKGNISQSVELLTDLQDKYTFLQKDKKTAYLILGWGQLLKQQPIVPKKQYGPLFQSKRNHILMVLHSSVTNDTNGYSTRSHGLLKGLLTTNWETTALTRPGYPWDQKKERIINQETSHHIDDVIYINIPGINMKNTPINKYLEQAADYIELKARELCPEIIHAASNHLTALPALIAARRLGLPFIYEVRGLWELTHASTDPSWIHTERFELTKALEVLTASNADHVLTLTSGLKRELISRGISDSKISLLPNSVDMDQFTFKEKDQSLFDEIGLKKGIPTVGYIGSIVSYEGLDDLIYALKDLQDQEVDFNFLLAGSGAYIDKLLKLVETLGLNERFYFVGRVPFEAVNKYYSLIDICPFPRKPFLVTEIVSPLKPFEAMAMKKCILVSSVGALKEIVDDDTTGLIFEKGNIKSLTIQLKRLIESHELRSKLAENAYIWVQKNRTWQKTAEVLSDIYAETVRLEKEAVYAQTSFKKPKVAIIMDKFSHDSFIPEFNAIEITPETWKDVFIKEKPEFFIVESAWSGNNGAWTRKVGYYGESEFFDLKCVIEYCRSIEIPTIFYNKEDPVHFERFKITSSYFDHVFTTDFNSIKNYQELKNSVIKTVESMPFFAQPKIHNPILEVSKKDDAVIYGGTYYSGKFKERSKDVHKLLKASKKYNLKIYDRQHGDPTSPYKFPEEFASFVKGSLEYDEMISAYKKNKIVLNVNSVQKSPTMFARRVFEVLACGSALVSGESDGIRRIFGNTVAIPETEEKAEQIIGMLLQNNSLRRSLVFSAQRKIWSEHTAKHRLVQMLRSTGKSVSFKNLENYSIIMICNDMKASQNLFENLFNQTHLPFDIIVGNHSSLELTNIISEAKELGISVKNIALEDSNENNVYKGLSQYALCNNIAVVSDGLSYIETCFEDLLHCKKFTDADVIGFPLSSDGKDKHTISESNNFNLAVQVFRSIVQKKLFTNDMWNVLQNEEEYQTQLKDNNHIKIYATEYYEFTQEIHNIDYLKILKRKKTVLVAGHDFKFIGGLLKKFEADGYIVIYDKWDGHNTHNIKESKNLLKQADIIICEWCLGNAVWYSKNKFIHQKLLIRFHLQEIDLNYGKEINMHAVNNIIFVGPHILRDAIQTFNWIQYEKKLIEIPNYIDTTVLPKQNNTIFNLGIVGIVPQRKRFDLALEILEKLRHNDKNFQLYVKGKTAKDFPWMEHRHDELKYYKDQEERIENSKYLRGSVHYDGFGKDMLQWYSKIGFILSTSDFESFHLSIPDGAVSGSIPIILKWEGSDEIYPASWSLNSIEDAVKKILLLSNNNDVFLEEVKKCKDYVEKFSLQSIYRQWECLLEENKE